MKRIFLATLAVLCPIFVSSHALAQCPSVSWGTPQTLANPTAVHDLVAVDFDSDGKMDLVGEMDTQPPVINDDLYSWKGHGDGTFDPPVDLNEHYVRDVALADVNNDGRKDIVMATYRGVISVRLNTGSGLGPAITTYTNGYQGDRIAVGNFDGDAYPDVAIASYWSNMFVTYHGVGNGTFTELRRVNAQTPLPFAAGDFDGDGRDDIAYGIRDLKNVYVAFRNADGSFTSPVTLPAVDFPSDLGVADFNEDGKKDLVAVNWEEYASIPLSSVMVFQAGASRTFTRSIMNAQILNSTASYYSCKVADMNGDGHQDIITAAANGSLSLTFLGKGDGTFRSPVHHIIPDPYDVSVGDVDGDSRPDMLVGGWNGLSVLKNLCASHLHLYTVAKVINPNQPAQLRGLVAAISSSTALPRGTVTFKEGATVLGTVDVDANGIAALDYVGLSVGTHTIHAEFSGNSELGTATSLDITEEVITQTSSVRIILPDGVTPSYGTAYPVDAEITTRFGYTVLGWIMVSVDGVETQAAWAGSSTKAPLHLTPGPHVLTVHFYGDNLNPPSDSAPVGINVAKASTAMSYTGAVTVRQGTAHSLTFQINGPQGTYPPGTVQLKRGSTVLGSAPVVNNTASISVTLERGAHDVVALYSGDANFNSNALSLTLTVMQNTPLAIEARGTQSAISVRAVLPPNTTATTLYRRLGGTNDDFLPLNGWTPAVEFDYSASRGVLYDYRLEATVSGSVQTSNLDSAILFTDDGLTSGSKLIHHTHFDELRLAVNALRANAGLPPFSYDNLFFGAVVRASHLAALRNALTEARTALGMLPATYTDAAAAGTIVKAVQIQELRELAR